VLGAIDLFQIPLAFIMRGATRAIDLYIPARFVMIEIFWLNIVLIAVATGEKLFSRRGMLALAGAATLAPLWDYGFEIRHDNLLLSGVLLMWCCARPGKLSFQGCMAVGLLSVAMQFAAFKAFVYTVPIAIGMLLFGEKPQGVARWKLCTAFVSGAALALCAVRILYGYSGVWEIYMHGARWVTKASAGGSHRFAPWFTLQRLLVQTPLLLAACTAAAVYVLVNIPKFAKRNSVWNTTLPEFSLVMIGFAALAANPTPFPYNLVLLVPFLYLLAFRHAKLVLEQRPELELSGPVSSMRNTAILPSVAATVIFTHLVPFGVATLRHLQYPNTRQDLIMGLAEKLTDPAKDPVCDGTGMVPTRPIVHPNAFLHSLTINSFLDGSGPRFRHLMASNPPAVFIPSYRTDGLPDEDHAYVRDHYISLADDFWVLGSVLPLGGGKFEIIHPGRYRISTLAGSDLAGTYPGGIKGLLTPPDDGRLVGTFDGRELSSPIQELSVGIHDFSCGSNVQPAVVWVGPRADRPRRFNPSDHQSLFVNWY
jgi:hypothetical protein